MRKENSLEKDKELSFSRKEFINLPFHQKIAACMVEIKTFDKISFEEIEKYLDGEEAMLNPHRTQGIDASIAIADCNRVINLHLNIINDETMENAIYKINTIIEILTDARDHLLNQAIPTLKEFDEKIALETERRNSEKNN